MIAHGAVTVMHYLFIEFLLQFVMQTQLIVIFFVVNVIFQDGRSFTIQNQAKFAKDLLPLNYKHNNMASFIRQLNMCKFSGVFFKLLISDLC